MSEEKTPESNRAESRSGVIFFCSLNKRHFLSNPNKGGKSYTDSCGKAHINVLHAKFQMAQWHLWEPVWGSFCGEAVRMQSIRKARRMYVLSFQWENGCLIFLGVPSHNHFEDLSAEKGNPHPEASHMFLPSATSSSFTRLRGAQRVWAEGPERLAAPPSPQLSGCRLRVLSHSSHVRLFVAPWAVAPQAPVSTGFCRQGHQSGLPCPPADLPDPGIKPASLISPALAGEFFTTAAVWEAQLSGYLWGNHIISFLVPQCSHLRDGSEAPPCFLHLGLWSSYWDWRSEVCSTGEYSCISLWVMNDACVLSRVQLFTTPGVIAHQAPLSMGFFWQEYWSGLPCPPPGDLPDPGIEPVSWCPVLASRFLTTSAAWEACISLWV